MRLKTVIMYEHTVTCMSFYYLFLGNMEAVLNVCDLPRVQGKRLAMSSTLEYATRASELVFKAYKISPTDSLLSLGDALFTRHQSFSKVNNIKYELKEPIPLSKFCTIREKSME